MKLVEQISIVNNLISKVNSLQDDIGRKVCAEMNTVLQKNGGFNSLCKIARVLSDDKCDCYKLDVEMDDVKYFTYAPLVSADVECSFSAYKVILSDTRQSFSFDTLKMNVVVYCSSNRNQANNMQVK